MTPAPGIPPPLAIRLLTRRLRGECAEFIVGDLVEEFLVRFTQSPSAARRWFWRQVLRCLLRPPRLPSSSAVPSGDPFMRTVTADLRYGTRSLLRAPSFAAAVVAVLALGIGANTAMFSIVNAVLLRPLPFDAPQRIVRLFHIPPQNVFPGMSTFPVSPANFYDWQRQARAFEGMAIYRFRQFTLTGSGAPQTVLAGAVGAGFFELVRVQVAMGRTFLPEEDAPARNRVAILSDGFWKSHFGGAADAIGRTLQLNGVDYTIVGVMPARFSVSAWGATARDLWVPLAYTDQERANRDNHNAQVVARLRNGVDLAQAKSDMKGISVRLEREYPNDNAGWSATVIPLQELIVANIRLSLVVLLTAVALVLLIACANVGNLLFARALGRRKEIAIRAALGAGRGRVFQQLLAETLLLAAAGGSLGVLVARVTLSASARLLATQLPRADEVSIDARVILFAVGASLAAAVLAGALPALRGGRADLGDALKEGGRQEGAVGLRMRRLLIAGEVALSVVLLMTAGVMLRSLVALRQVDGGFNPRPVLTMRVSPAGSRYATAAQNRSFYELALERLLALPGVEAAGAVDDLPTQGGSVQGVVVDNQPERLPRDQPTVEVRRITPGYLETMGIPIRRGRDVHTGDDDVILVSGGAAKLLWGDVDPIGHEARMPIQRTGRKRVIGVVGEVKQGSFAEPAAPTIYEYTRSRSWGGMNLVLRTTRPPLSLAKPAVETIHAIDAQLPVESVQTMNDVIDDTMTSQRFGATLFGVFALVALTLASVGIYSVLSYIVRGRSHEIGIRTALGARPSDVLRLVVVEGMMPALAGIAIGSAVAVWTGRLIHSLVFGISASDPVTLAGVAAILALVALLAGLLPAYRASRVDPLTVLRG